MKQTAQISPEEIQELQEFKRSKEKESQDLIAFKESLQHYRGDAVRTLFIISGVIMIVFFPFFRPFINEPLSLSLSGAIILAIFGGLMNPRQRWVMLLNTIISIVAFLVFEFHTVYAYVNLSPAHNIHITFFWVNQILAILFFFATYLSTKSLRGSFLAEMKKR